MFRPRVMPCLLLDDGSLVKTIRFKGGTYLGDPINAVRIYNECEADELIFLDIHATQQKRRIDFELLRQIATECFMPLTYGGGIATEDDAAELFALGIEKIALNEAALAQPELIRRLSQRFGSQAIVVSMDVRRPLFGHARVYGARGSRDTRLRPDEWAQRAAEYGAGEILLNSIDRDGTWEGFDLETISVVSGAVDIPVIACGGAGSLGDVRRAIAAGASAAAAGSLFVFQKKGMGVLINYPTYDEIQRSLA
jgi:cyclase